MRFHASDRNIFKEYSFLSLFRASRAGALFGFVLFFLFFLVGVFIVSHPDAFLDMWTRGRPGHPSAPVYLVGVISLVFGLVFDAYFSFMLFPGLHSSGDYAVFRFFHRGTSRMPNNDPAKGRRNAVDIAYYKPPYTLHCVAAELDDNGRLTWTPAQYDRIADRPLSGWIHVETQPLTFSANLRAFDRIIVGCDFAVLEILHAPDRKLLPAIREVAGPLGTLSSIIHEDEPARTRFLGFEYVAPEYCVPLDLSSMTKRQKADLIEHVKNHMREGAKIIRF